MSTPLNVAIAIDRLIADAKARETAIDVSASADEIYLRYLASGCSRHDIGQALEGEAAAAGVTIH